MRTTFGSLTAPKAGLTPNTLVIDKDQRPLVRLLASPPDRYSTANLPVERYYSVWARGMDGRNICVYGMLEVDAKCIELSDGSPLYESWRVTFNSGESTHRAKERFRVPVWSYLDKAVRILDRGRDTFGSMNGLGAVTQNASWANPTLYDIVLESRNSGQFTTVVPVPQPDNRGQLPPEITEIVDSVWDDILDELTLVPKSPETWIEILGGRQIPGTQLSTQDAPIPGAGRRSSAPVQADYNDFEDATRPKTRGQRRDPDENYTDDFSDI